ncbi:MAG: hypothetical protein ACTSXP_17900, partial [Promethearchaeota archaeon]
MRNLQLQINLKNLVGQLLWFLLLVKLIGAIIYHLLFFLLGCNVKCWTTAKQPLGELIPTISGSRTGNHQSCNFRRIRGFFASIKDIFIAFQEAGGLYFGPKLKINAVVVF